MLADSDGAEISVPQIWICFRHYIFCSLDRVNTPAMIDKMQGIGSYRLT